MIYDIPKPEIIGQLTLENIRKIRDWHYEVLKDATREERSAFYKEGVEHFYKGYPMPKTIRPGED
ncbi:hypothetical protein AGMMS50276_25860 [Synergistales bacterium]|nr:hypothetical protein AGMMS50276_25860 [Synergistales bacterium]